MKKLKKYTATAMAGIMLLSLSGTITTSAQSLDENKVYLGGQPFGVKFYNDGVIIVELEEFYDGAHYVCPSKEGGLKVNDIIKKANGTCVNSNEELQSVIINNKGNPIDFEIIRDGKTQKKSVTPQKNTAGLYLLGAWVKDSCAGIGTVTYYDPNNHYFAALGHGICDNDTSALLPLGSAEIVNANISSVTKSTTGKPGSLNGYFTDETMGSLSKNTLNGIFGSMKSEDYSGYQTVTLATDKEIKIGKAEIYTTVDSGETKCYDAEITKLCNTDENSNENFVIKVTDKSLVEKCGGIVQGMSGSPVVQDNKLVGAVTHVFMNNPDEGYGVLIQNMVSKYNN